MQQSLSRFSRRGESAQAFLEFSFVALVMIMMLFGLIDFGRFVYERQVLVNLTREGSNLVSRGTDITNAVSAVVASANPLNLTTAGHGVVITAVTNFGGGFHISEQLAGGGVTAAASKIGRGTGNPATLPTTATNLPPANQTAYLTEVFYSFTPITPIGKLLQVTLPPTNYDVAFFVGP